MTPSELSAIRVECATARGWRFVREENYDAIYENEIYRGGATHDFQKAIENAGVPAFESDANAALTLAAALADEGWKCYANQGLDKTWECEFHRKPTEKTNDDDFAKVGGVSQPWMEVHYATAPTFALALCLAFLKVHRSKKD